MSPFVIAIVLFSASMHAGWNLLARQKKDEAPAFVGRMLLLIAVAGAAPAVAAEIFLGHLPTQAMLIALASGAICGVYNFALARGYSSGDFTTVYPVARALPLLLIALADALRDRVPTPAGWAGMALVTAGCLLAPQFNFRAMRLKAYLHASIFWILLTAAGTVGYTLLDKFAAEIVRQGPASAARYGYIFFTATWLSAGGLRALLRTERDARPSSIGWARPALGAILDFGGYWLILWAFQLTSRASYVIAFRQFSIVLGVIAAFAIYRETGRFTRITATVIIVAGLLAIALGGR